MKLHKSVFWEDSGTLCKLDLVPWEGSALHEINNGKL